MSAGTIFVLILALGFVAFIIYLARLSKRTREEEIHKADEKPPMKRAS
jgi:hypothetical protein